MTTSALNIITEAAQLLGVVFKSESLSSDEANDGLIALNDMLDSWSNDGLIISAYTLESFSLTGAASYTIGSGGTFNTVRPISIATAVIRYSSVDYPLEFITQEAYQQQIAIKTLTSPIPDYITYDNDYPLGKIKLYPLDTAGSTLYLQSNKPLTNLSALTTTVSLPPGWKRALKYNLALELAPQYTDNPPSPLVIQTARESLGMLRYSVCVNNAMPLIGDVPYVSGYNKILGG